MVEELHLWMDNKYLDLIDHGFFIHDTYIDTELALMNHKIPVIHTTQIEFLDFRYAKRLFVHIYGEEHEITLGNCEGTDKEIRPAHKLSKMLINGAFDYYKPII